LPPKKSSHRGGRTRRGRRKRKQNARRSPRKTGDAGTTQATAGESTDITVEHLEEEKAKPMAAVPMSSEFDDQIDAVKVKRPKPKPAINPAGFVFVGDAESDDQTPWLAADREPQGGQKVSAFTMALIAHFALALLGGFVVVNLPQTKPPQIVAVNVMAEREPEIAPRLVKRDVPKAASASAPPASIVSSSAPSDFSVPEFDTESAPDLSMLMSGVDIGQGMSFTGEGQESNVNFFGIRSGGKKIAFVVDATRYMLVDEKGGMFAYDKVKAEVAAMLAQLKRGTAFNIILYEGKNLSLFREEPVAAKPSAIRLASQWLDSLNRNYDQLGLRGRSGSSGQITGGVGVIEARDNLGYAKAIQMALEMDVNAVFAISSGYQRITRSLDAEQRAEVRKMSEGRIPGKVSKADRDRWNKAQADTRDWLRKENDARATRGLAPKVVTNFNALVRQVTGQTPPRATGGDTGPPPRGMPRPGPPYTAEEIEKHIEKVVVHFYMESNEAIPEIHMVLFLGEDEDIGDAKDHFRRLTRRNKGKLQILEGLAALSDVTGK